MALSRTWFTALIDDSGSRQDGSVWQKSSVDSLLDSIDAILIPPACRVRHSVNLSVSSATLTVHPFDTERFDTDTMHDPTTNPSRLTCRTAGMYLIGCCVEWAASTSGYRLLLLRLNGTTGGPTNGYLAESLVDPAPTGETSQTLSVMVRLAVGDYVEILVVQTTGAALNSVAHGNTAPECWAVKVAD